MEGQKFKIPQDPCQTLPEPSVAYGPNSVDFVLKFSRVPFRGDLGQHLLEKFSNRSWIRRCMISCPPHFVDEINDSIVNSERGELVRGSDPPLVQSALYGR